MNKYYAMKIFLRFVHQSSVVKSIMSLRTTVRKSSPFSSIQEWMFPYFRLTTPKDSLKYASMSRLRCRDSMEPIASQFLIASISRCCSIRATCERRSMSVTPRMRSSARIYRKKSRRVKTLNQEKDFFESAAI